MSTARDILVIRDTRDLIVRSLKELVNKDISVSDAAVRSKMYAQLLYGFKIEMELSAQPKNLGFIEHDA